MKRKIKDQFNEEEQNIFIASNSPENNPNTLFGRKLTRGQSTDILWRPIYIISKGQGYCIPLKLTEPIITYKIDQYV